MNITLKAARVNAGLTQGQAAKLMDVSVQTIVKWEKGAVRPSLASIELLSKIYNCPKQYFILP